MTINAYHHIISGLKADIQTLVAADFVALDVTLIDHVHEAMMILKMTAKILSPRQWQECLRNYGPMRYRKMNLYLETCMGTRLKAELAMRRTKPLSEKQAELRQFAYIPAKDSVALPLMLPPAAMPFATDAFAMA